MRGNVCYREHNIMRMALLIDQFRDANLFSIDLGKENSLTTILVRLLRMNE